MVRPETDLVAFSLVIREVIVLQVSMCVCVVCVLETCIGACATKSQESSVSQKEPPFFPF